MEYAAGKSNSLWSLAGKEVKHIVTQPHIFFPGFSFRWMYMVYAATYTANNLGEHLNITENISQPIQKLFFVFVVNTVCSLIKDKKYAVHFGNPQKAPFPISSLTLLFRTHYTEKGSFLYSILTQFLNNFLHIF